MGKRKICVEVGPRIKLTLNKEYTILEETNKFFGRAVIVINDKGERQAYMASRFR